MTAREKILEATRKCLIEKGSNSASIKTIARIAEVNHGLIHHYFGSKENLFIETLQYHFGIVINNLDQLESREELIDFFISNISQDIRLLVEVRSLAYQMPMLEKELKITLPRLRAIFGRVVGVEDHVSKVLIAALITGLAIHTTLDSELPVQEVFTKLFQTLESV